MKVILKPIPHQTKRFLVEGNEGQNNFFVLAQKQDKTKHILHRNLTQNQAITLATKYIIKFEG